MHVLCGLFASNIIVSDWGHLSLEFSSEISSINEIKSQCVICLKYSLKPDVWKCCSCDKQAHFICMLIDTLINEDPNARTWTSYLSFSPNYHEILADFHDFKGILFKNLSGFTKNKAFSQIKHESFDKGFINDFLMRELDDLKKEMRKLGNIKEKMGEKKLHSGTLFSIFCPSHYEPLCCFAEQDDTFICCDYCGKFHLKNQ